jgi:hypothetical protein
MKTPSLLMTVSFMSLVCHIQLDLLVEPTGHAMGLVRETSVENSSVMVELSFPCIRPGIVQDDTLKVFAMINL